MAQSQQSAATTTTFFPIMRFQPSEIIEQGWQVVAQYDSIDEVIDSTMNPIEKGRHVEVQYTSSDEGISSITYPIERDWHVDLIGNWVVDKSIEVSQTSHSLRDRLFFSTPPPLVATPAALTIPTAPTSSTERNIIIPLGVDLHHSTLAGQAAVDKIRAFFSLSPDIPTPEIPLYLSRHQKLERAFNQQHLRIDRFRGGHFNLPDTHPIRLQRQEILDLYTRIIFWDDGDTEWENDGSSDQAEASDDYQDWWRNENEITEKSVNTEVKVFEAFDEESMDVTEEEHSDQENTNLIEAGWPPSPGPVALDTNMDSELMFNEPYYMDRINDESVQEVSSVSDNFLMGGAPNPHFLEAGNDDNESDTNLKPLNMIASFKVFHDTDQDTVFPDIEDEEEKEKLFPLGPRTAEASVNPETSKESAARHLRKARLLLPNFGRRYEFSPPPPPPPAERTYFLPRKRKWKGAHEKQLTPSGPPTASRFPTTGTRLISIEAKVIKDEAMGKYNTKNEMAGRKRSSLSKEVLIVEGEGKAQERKTIAATRRYDMAEVLDMRNGSWVLHNRLATHWEMLD